MAYTKTALKEQLAYKYELPDGLSSEDLTAISDEALAVMKDDKDVKHIVLDIGSNTLEFKLLRSLTLLGTQLKSDGKKLCIRADRRSVHNMIMSEGLSGVIIPIVSLNEITPVQDKKAASKIDVGFINPFIEGVIHVLKVQCNLECQPGKPFLKTEDSDLQSADIAGVIGISSPHFRGSISICFSESTFLLLISRMFGEEFTEITADLEDGAGELLNMIFGHAKRILNEKGYAIDKALPTVVRGKGVTVNHISEQGTIILPFKAEDSGFYMEICTEQRN